MGKVRAWVKRIDWAQAAAIVGVAACSGIFTVAVGWAKLDKSIALIEHTSTPRKEFAELKEIVLTGRQARLDEQKRQDGEHSGLHARVDSLGELNTREHAEIKSTLRDLGVKLDRVMERLPPVPALSRRPTGTAEDPSQ